MAVGVLVGVLVFVAIAVGVFVGVLVAVALAVAVGALVDVPVTIGIAESHSAATVEAGAVIGNRLHLVSGMITSAAAGAGQDPKMEIHTSSHDVIDLPNAPNTR